MKKYLFLLTLLAFPLLPLSAQELALTAQEVPSQVSFAKPFTAHFELAHAPGLPVELEESSLPAGFELTQTDIQARSAATAAYELTFLPLTLEPSTFTVSFVLKDKASPRPRARITSEPLLVKVNPVKLFQEQTLRDIRPPVIPLNFWPWILLALLMALTIYMVCRSRRAYALDPALQPTPEDTRPADVIALSKIQLLLDSGLWEQAEYKLFYSELGHILREYFWRRWQLDVSADTSVELLRRARKNPQLQPLLVPLRNYLASADLVKFAKVQPQQTTMQQDVQTVRRIVQQTTPPPTEEN